MTNVQKFMWEQDQYREEKNKNKVLGVMDKGHLFGEIGVLTNLGRTCTVISNENCLFQTLSKESLIELRKAYPSTVQSLLDRISDYNDNDMVQRRLIVHNVPYFRNLEIETIE